MGEGTYDEEVAAADAIADKVSAIAKAAWAKARQADMFEEAVDIYHQELLSALYGFVEQQR